jgi:murein DD-endopeptidase MepM/ murein hydrolase activator NlpD
VNTFWRVFRRFRWLCLLFALLACLPPQITILAPVLPEAALSASADSQQDTDVSMDARQAYPEGFIHDNNPQDHLDIAVVAPDPDPSAQLVASALLPEQGNETPLNSGPAAGSEALLSGLPPAESVLSVSPPLRFNFPDPAPPLTSAWRPPLYPTPWAKAPQDHFYFIRPIAADDINWPLWDYRYGGMFFENVVHTGIDIPARVGTPVIAAGSGKIIWAGSGLYRGVDAPDDPYGLAIAILHDFSYMGERLYTIYGHMDRIDVAYGQLVQAGDPLGLSGETGIVTGPHLHFEVRIGKNGFFSTRNPELWLAPPQGWGLLAGRVMNTGGKLIAGQSVQVVSLDTSVKQIAKSYGLESVNSDPYYQENIVISDLPAGLYEIRIAYGGFLRTQPVEIKPGLVSYFTFQGHRSFGPSVPPSTQVEFPFPP